MMDALLVNYNLALYGQGVRQVDSHYHGLFKASDTCNGAATAFSRPHHPVARRAEV
jgi:hypothetical protein